jgi:hypothetical protein
MSFAIGSSALRAAHGLSERILDVESVWNHTVYQVRIPRLAMVEQAPAVTLSPAQPTNATCLGYTSTKPLRRENKAEAA